MLFDWLSLKLTFEDCPAWSGWLLLSNYGDRVVRICAKTGDVRWTVAAWDSLRSDSHQVAVLASEQSIRVQGSPARVMGHGDTVFGFGTAARDVGFCARSMLDFVARRLGLPEMPDLRFWRCSRVDVTANYVLGSLADVRVSLAELRNVEGGRYRVSQVAGDTVYWSAKSKRKAGKAYAKGPHLRYLLKQATYTGCGYAENDLELAGRLLRLELRLGSKYFSELRKSRISWFSLSWLHWFSEFDAFFGRMIGDVEVLDMASMVEKLMLLDDPSRPDRKMSQSAANAVFRTWASIESIGLQATRELMNIKTYYRHLRCLRDIGISDADMSNRKIAFLRRKVLMQPVSSWDELRKAA